MPPPLVVNTDVVHGTWRAGDAGALAFWQKELRSFVPVEQVVPSTRVRQSGDILPTAPGQERFFEAPLTRTPLGSTLKNNSVPIQVWEGTVIEVDAEQGVMHVLLDAKLGDIPRHTGEIELEWVSEQDKDLVVPGAMFYLTLFKRTSPSVENTQELRFRRRPAWSAEQLKQIDKDAVRLSAKLKTLPIAT